METPNNFGLSPGIKWLRLVEISEPLDNALRVVMIEMSPQGEPVITVEDGPDGREVLPISGEKALEFYWDTYILYSTINESYIAVEQNTPRPKSNLREIDDKIFTSFVEKATIATKDYPGPYKLWRLFSVNHIILVASCVEPRVIEIDVEARWLDREGPRIFLHKD